jgi:hypothetical protein
MRFRVQFVPIVPLVQVIQLPAGAGFAVFAASREPLYALLKTKAFQGRHR